MSLLSIEQGTPMVVHSLTTPTERNKYSHIECYHQPIIDKVARFRTTCPRCKEIITPQSPIEKHDGKWAHLGCQQVQILEQTLSPYEKLLQLTLIAEDITEINEESQTSGITSSSGSSRVSTFVPETSTSCTSSNRKRHADDFTTPQKT